MQITSETFGFPFKDDRWKHKALIGALLGLGAFLIVPMFFLYGYGIRVLRRTVEGESPSLPEWDEWGAMFVDGLRFFAVSFLYGLPASALMCGMLSILFAGMLGGPFLIAAGGDSAASAEAGFGAMLILSTLGGLGIGVVSLLSFPLQFLGLVGLTRGIALGNLGAAFEVGEVWKLAKAGFSRFALAYAIWYAVLLGLSMVVSFLMYTVVLICVYPLLVGVISMYSFVLLGVLFGTAYRETQAKLGAEAEAV